MQDKYDIGKAIAKRRHERLITQADLAELSGISKGFLSEVENGKKKISAQNLYNIAEALCCKMDDFFTDKIPKTEKRYLKAPQMMQGLIDHGYEYDIEDFIWHKKDDSRPDFIPEMWVYFPEMWVYCGIKVKEGNKWSWEDWMIEEVEI